MKNVIRGNKFKALADWCYAPAPGCGGKTKNEFGVNDYRYLVNTLDKSRVKDGDIIYTPTFYADSLLDELGNFDKRVKIITHNADNNMSFSPPDYVIKWFSQNVNIIHEKVVALPIGLENDHWFPEKEPIMLKKLSEPRRFKNLVYMNHNVATNPKKRIRPYEVLEHEPWVTAERGANGSGFESYIDNIYNHRFVVCPEGNGIDTHRLWECLYMGSIPIAERNITNMQFVHRGFPIFLVDSWDEFEEGNLLSVLRHSESDRSWEEMLGFDYWEKLIRE